MYLSATQVLKYSEADMAKVLLDQQSRLLAKERDWEKRENQLLADLKQEKETNETLKRSNEDMQWVLEPGEERILASKLTQWLAS